MTEGITQDYDAILEAARKLSPANQFRLAKKLVSGDQLVTFWEDCQRQLAEQGQIACDVEIDASVAKIRAELQRGKRL